MNMPAFSSSFFAEADGSHLWPGRVDQIAEALREMLFSGKFNSMFSLLFGIGFTLQFARIQQLADPEHATRIYLRRLLVLGVLGVVHAALFWGGDVLHVYAILGIVLLFGLRHASDRTLIALMGLCLLYPVISGTLRLLVVTPDLLASQVADSQGFRSSGQRDLRPRYVLAGRFASRAGVRLFLQRPAGRMGLLRLLRSDGADDAAGPARRPAPLAGSARRADAAAAQGARLGAGGRARLRRALRVIFELNRVPGPSPIKLVGGVAYWLSRLAMMIFYVLTIVRLAQQPAWPKHFAPIAAAGRTPLTNYLMQTAICTVHLLRLGISAWWGEVGPAARALMLALAIFFCLIQVPLSVMWFQHFTYGPLEYLWRSYLWAAFASAGWCAPVGWVAGRVTSSAARFGNAVLAETSRRNSEAEAGAKVHARRVSECV